MNRFFVYGTLKVGGRFAKGFDNSRLKSTTAVLSGFNLYDLGWFPGIKEGDGEVHGELHEYDNVGAVTKELDRIEGFSENDKTGSLFVRKRLPVKTDKGIVEANVYVFNRALGKDDKLVQSGIWEI